MLRYVPYDPAELAGKDWMWIERPDGRRYMVVAEGREVIIPAAAVCALARQVEEQATASSF